MDILQTLSNMGRKISEAKLPYIWDWKQRKMPTYTDGALAFQWLWVAPWAEWLVQLGGWTAAPWLLAPNAIDTVVNWLPNVYNWVADEYNVWAYKRAYNNQMKNVVDEDTKRKIQRRGMGQIGRDPSAQTSLTWRAIPRMERVTKYAAQPVTYLWPSTTPMIVDATAVEPVWTNALANQMANASAQTLAKTKIVNALGKMANSWSLTSKGGAAKARALIDLYKKLK